jgi:guanylate kinase
VKRGLLFILSGPSGVGKDELVKHLLRRDPGLRYSVSCTTRPRRDYELDGVHYNFVTREEFERMRSEGAFLESAEYNGNLYGTSRDFIENLQSEGFDVILKIEVRGAAQVRERRPDGIFVFIAPPSLEELERRRQGRGEDASAERQRIAVAEMAEAPKYDHVVVNDDLDRAVDEILRIIRAARETAAQDAS